MRVSCGSTARAVKFPLVSPVNCSVLPPSEDLNTPRFAAQLPTYTTSALPGSAATEPNWIAGVLMKLAPPLVDRNRPLHPHREAVRPHLHADRGCGRRARSGARARAGAALRSGRSEPGGDLPAEKGRAAQIAPQWVSLTSAPPASRAVQTSSSPSSVSPCAAGAWHGRGLVC